MAGKKKKESKKKKKGKDSQDGLHIASGLFPSAMFAALPRSPPRPPATDKLLTSSITSTVLNSSILGYMIGTPSPVSEEQVISQNETDTSLYDFDSAGYATLDFRAGPSRDAAGSPVRPPTAYLDGRYADDEVSSDDGIGNTHSSGRFVTVQVEPSRTDGGYSRVRRNKRDGNESDLTNVTDDLGPPSASMQRYRDDDNRALRGKRSRSYSPGSTSKSRSPSPRVYYRPERDTPDIESRRGEVSDEEEEDPTSADDDTESDFLHSTSPKLALLAEQNSRLLEQVEQQQLMMREQQQQLQVQHDMQQKVLERLGQSGPQLPADETLQEMNTLLSSTKSMTEVTLKRQEEVSNSLKQRSGILEQEKFELMELNEQLQAEINSLRRMASFKDTGSLHVTFEGDEEGSGSQIMLLKKHLQDSKDERDTLRAAVQRLNVELSKYQAKYRELSNNEEGLGLPLKGPVPSWLVNAKYLAPLFLAYDDRLHEKDELIMHYEDELSAFRERIADVIKENDRLHIRLEQSDGPNGPMSMTEWRQLQEQCKLVLEENQLLMEQLDLQHHKTAELHRNHLQEVSKLSKKIVVAEADRTEMESQLHQSHRKYEDVKKKYDSTVFTSHNKLNVEEHVTVVTELKRSQEDERHKLEHELENTLTKLKTIQSEKKGLALQFEDLRAENRHLEQELKAMHKTNRKAQRKMSLLERMLAELESREHKASTYLSDVVRSAEKTALERDSFAIAAQKEERQKKKALNKLMEGALEKDRMEEKLKLYKLRYSEKLHKASTRMKAQDKDFSMERAEYDREVRHLRMLLREREELLEMMTGEKHTVEDDLETMWQVATADNKRMRETMRQSIRKLREHAGLGDIISSELDEELTAELLQTEHKT